LSADYLDRVNLRIEIMRFTKELLRDQRRTSGGWTAASPASIAMPVARRSNTI